MQHKHAADPIEAFMGGGINAFSGAVGPPQTPAKLYAQLPEL